MRLDATTLGISKTCETAFNTPVADAANYDWLPTTEPVFILPKMEKTSDANRVGRNAPSHLCNTYWQHGEISAKDDVETNVPGRLFRRGLGGSVTDTAVVAGVYDHEFAILPPQVGDILPSFDVISVLGAADFLLCGVMVDKLKFSQKNSDRVQHETSLVSSGKFVNPSGITPPPITDSPCLDGFRVKVTYRDVLNTLVDLSSEGKISDWFVEHNNKIKRNRRRVGDPLQTIQGQTAALVKKMPRGKYETKAQMVVDFEDLTDWIRAVKSEVLTDLRFTIPGPKIATVAGKDYFHEFEIILPVFTFDAPDIGEDDGDATTPINIVCLEDPVTKGTLKGRIRNASPTLI